MPLASKSAIGVLRVLLACTVIAPALLFATASWLNLRSALAEAQTDLLHSSEVAREHAAKVFDGQSQVADRVNDLVRGLDAPAIQAAEKPLHEALAAMVARLPQVQSVLLVDQRGRPLVSAGVYPMPRDVSVAERDYFKAVMAGYDGTYVSSLQLGEVSKKLFFGLARPWTGAGDAVQGVIDVAVSPSFFLDFYRLLVEEGRGGPEGQVVTLFRDDGQILLRYPPFDGEPPRASANSAFMRAIAANPESGLYEGRSMVDPGAPERLYAYRRVQGYPVYVVAGRSRAAVIDGWRRSMAGHLIFGVPATIALFALTWTALVRAQREEQALARARDEMQRREDAEAALLRAQRLEAVGQMTGGVAHDFNNLLTVILGSAEILLKRADDPERVRRLANQILLAAQRGGEVTQKLLAFSRRQVTKPEVVDLDRRLAEFKPLLDRAASELVSVDLDLCGERCAVRVDPGHFEAAILNLVGNARDAMPSGGRVVVSTRLVQVDPASHPDLPEKAYIRVSVADTGSGMDAQTAAKAFEPFFTTKDVGRGTGLGLSQVYGFAKQSGGDVHIVSAPGEGTRVELLLPQAAGQVAERPASSPAAGHARPGEVVLVVEDEASVLAMTADTLRELGYVALTAAAAAAALDHLRAPGRIDVLFSDVMMPGGMDGLHLATEARRLRPGLRVLLTSGYAANFDRGRAGDTPLLTKPYDQAQLAEALRAVLLPTTSRAAE